MLYCETNSKYKNGPLGEFNLTNFEISSLLSIFFYSFLQYRLQTFFMLWKQKSYIFYIIKLLPLSSMRGRKQLHQCFLGTYYIPYYHAYKVHLNHKFLSLFSRWALSTGEPLYGTDKKFGPNNLIFFVLVLWLKTYIKFLC